MGGYFRSAADSNEAEIFHRVLNYHANPNLNFVMEAVKMMAKKNLFLTLTLDRDQSDVFVAKFYDIDQGKLSEATDADPSIAICKAALEADEKDFLRRQHG